MPVSKKRKEANKSLRRKAKPAKPLELVDGIHRIKTFAFQKLREKENFRAMIRIGRLLNTLTYAMQLVMDRPSPDTPTGLRYHYRTLFITGGYLYEGFLLLDDLRSKYKAEPFFSKFESLLSEDKRRRKIVQKIRDSVGFPLDWRDKATPSALAKLNLPYYELISTGGTLGTVYFYLADTVDLNYLLDELRGENSELETSEEIYKTIYGLLDEFAKAADQFIHGVSIKLELI
jgi:hypothetical protein